MIAVLGGVAVVFGCVVAAEAWFVPQESGVITHILLMCLLCVVHHIGVSAALNDTAKGQRLVPH